MKVTGKLVDIHSRDMYPAEILVNNGIIESITRIKSARNQYILPGLVDAHIHIESSMVTPGSFARAAVSRGTVAVVSDPHEIANVLGTEGVRYMIRDSKKVPLKFCFGAPSCVPATSFETSGAMIGPDEIEELLEKDGLKYLSEMMNYPGVIYNDPDVRKKIDIARKLNRPVDGHAPGLNGELLKKYVSAGITTDHECTTIKEAREKIALGMKVLIREGSAAKNMNELKELIRTNPEMVMLCSDDLHPEMLARRHINKLAAQLISEGYDLFDVIRSCTINPVMHYGIEAGLLKPGDPGDFIITEDLHSMDIRETWINGEKVYGNGKVLFDYTGSDPVNKFNCSMISAEDIVIISAGKAIRVIEAFDGALITKEARMVPEGSGVIDSNIEKDTLKIVVKDRYNDSPPAAAFIKGFGLKSGAFASSVAHDCHNIICVGTNDSDIIDAVNEIVKMKGGLSVADGGSISSLQLPVAGIMSDQPVEKVAAQYEELTARVKVKGCKMSAPFMTLSFMALLVIPELKLSDRGLFDGNKFILVPLFVD
jgi:adenine deaminase